MRSNSNQTRKKGGLFFILLGQIILAFSAWPVSAAGPCTEAVGSGAWVVSGHTTPEEARHLALNRARINAIENACGLEARGVSLVENMAFAGAYHLAQSYGHIVKEECKWQDKKVQVFENEPPVQGLTAEIKACVVCNVGRDWTFTIQAALNRSMFLNGDEAEITFSVSQDAYIYIFNLQADDRIAMLFPNKYMPENLMQAGETYLFPGVSWARMQVSTLPGHKVDHEAVYLLICKQKLNFAYLFPELGSTVSREEFFREIMTIPVDQRQEKILAYEVRVE